MLKRQRVTLLSLIILAISLGHNAWAQDIFVKPTVVNPTQPAQHPVDLGLGVRPTAQPQQQSQQHVAQPPD